MQWIIDFFSSLFTYWKSVWSLIFSAFTGLLDILTSLPQLLSTVTQAINGLPTVLTTFILATITVSVVFLVIGRGNGGD